MRSLTPIGANDLSATLEAGIALAAAIGAFRITAFFTRPQAQLAGALCGDDGQILFLHHCPPCWSAAVCTGLSAYLVLRAARRCTASS